MTDLAQIVPSTTPATPDIKAVLAANPAEAAVQADFLSLLSGQMSGLPNESNTETSTTAKALTRGKGVPLEDNSGNLIPPITGLAPLVVSVAAMWATAGIDGETS